MNNIEKRIDIVKNIISKHFYIPGTVNPSCFAQSYILYKYICNLISKDTSLPLPLPVLVKGYIINHSHQVYYGHFWVEYNDRVYDPATETFLKNYPEHMHNEIMNNQRILEKTIPERVKYTYTNKDDDNFELLRNRSYSMCMENKFLEDARENCGLEVYKHIEYIYNKLIH